MASDELQLTGRSMFFIGGAVGTALATVIGFMTMMALDESATVVVPSTPTSAVATGGVPVTLVEEVDSSIVFIGTEFAYSPMGTSVEGPFELVFENAGRVIHNLEIEGVSGLLLEANPGRAAAENIQLETGEYVIFCSIPGHRAAGMEGTLTVEEG